MATKVGGKPETYTNPVYPHSFPDPFVLKFRGEYFAYCTGNAPDGNVFGILRSSDLVDWTPVGSAMAPLASRPPFYWAPEVVYDNGKFHLYYSAGNEILMEIRMAVSERPDGGFVDSGVRLTHEEFAIDAHVFIDDDGRRYLFYATDFLEHSHIGTGTVVDRMLDRKTLEGEPRPVTRAKYDWQVYDPARKEKGGVRWHTVEGPTVLKHKGKYFEMFSGGNWQNKSYGVSFAATSDINSGEEWDQFSDGEKILPILRSIPDVVVGPGHNSVVRGPNNRELYCVYHRWTDAGRVLAIDRMDFAGDRIFVAGPTVTEQPAPFKPTSCLSSAEMSGNWQRVDDELVSNADERCELSTTLAFPAFLFECSFRLLIKKPGRAHFGCHLESENSRSTFTIMVGRNRAMIVNSEGRSSEIKLSNDFDHAAFHSLRIEAVEGHLRVMIDDPRSVAEIEIFGKLERLVFFSEGGALGLSAFENTYGFEELFYGRDSPPPYLSAAGRTAECDGRILRLTPAGGNQVSASFDVPSSDLEIAANLAVDVQSVGAEYGLLLFDGAGKQLARLAASTIDRHLRLESGGEHIKVALPEAYSGNEFRQFRTVCQGGICYATLDGIEIARLAADDKAQRAAVFSTDSLLVDMVRATAI